MVNSLREKLDNETRVEISEQKVQEYQLLFDSFIRPKRNHILFEVNLLSGDITRAKFEEIPPLNWWDAVKGNLSLTKKVVKQPNCVYISALNVENVKRILEKNKH